MPGPKLFWIEPDDRMEPVQEGTAGVAEGSFLLFPGRDLDRHLKKSLRARIGDRFSFCLPEVRRIFSGRVASLDPFSLELSPSHDDSRIVPSVRIGLALAPIKGDGFSSILGLATMSGIHQILPLLTERSVVDWGEKSRWESKQSRLLGLVREKSQLAGRSDRMLIENPVSLPDFFRHSEGMTLLWFDEFHEGAMSVKGLLEMIQNRPGSLEKIGWISCLWGIVGPEGGWSDSERMMARSLESQGRLFRVSLGNLTFSAESAAFSVISLLGLVLSPFMEIRNQRQSLLAD
ncbi:MAG: RsmE family RNA methyltransferase [Leptospirales bacterium]